MRKRKGGNLQISSTMVFFPLYFIMDSGYTNEVSVYKLYLLGVNLSVTGRVLGQAFLRTTSPSRLRRATSPGRGGFGSPRKVNGFARGSPTRGAVERSETERLYEGKPDREPLLDSTSPSALTRCHLPYRGEALAFRKVFLLSSKFSSYSSVICSPSSSARISAPVAGRLRTR